MGNDYRARMTDAPDTRQAPADAGVLQFRAPITLTPRNATPEQIIAALHEAWSEKVAAYAFKKTGDQDDADDLVSLVFMDLWNRHVSQGKEPRAGYLAFLFGAINYRTESRKRKHARRSRLLEAGNYVTSMLGSIRSWMQPSYRVEVEDLERLVNESLQEMTPRCAEMQMLHRHSGMTIPEIAEALEISTETVSTLLQKGNRLIRERINDTSTRRKARRVAAHSRGNR
jgi:RNA polymerase sigma factor (sigma-70 family)